MEEDENKKEDPKEKVVLNFESDSDKTIQCQKQVLVEKSDYFKAMFSSGMVESQNNTVEMKDIDIDLMRCLVEFMMSGEINLTENNIYEITEAATRFQVADLISLCSAFLKKILSFENCFKMLEYSKQFNLKKLHNKCKAFIQHNFCKIWGTDEFVSLDVTTLKWLIKQPELNVNSEKDVYDAIEEWIFEDVGNRVKYAKELFEYVHFEDIDIPYCWLENMKYCNLSKEDVMKRRSEKEKHGIKKFRQVPQAMLCVGVQFLTEDAENNVYDTKIYKLDLKEYKSVECVGDMSDVIPVFKDYGGYSVCLHDKDIIISGGMQRYTETEWNLDVFCFDIFEYKWSKLTELKNPRRDHASFITIDCLFVLGGNGRRCESFLNTMEKYDFKEDKWTNAASSPREGFHRAVTVVNKHVYALIDKKDVYHYKPYMDEWTYMFLPMTMKFDSPEPSFIWASSFGDKIYVIDSNTKLHVLKVSPCMRFFELVETSVQFQNLEETTLGFQICNQKLYCMHDESDPEMLHTNLTDLSTIVERKKIPMLKPNVTLPFWPELGNLDLIAVPHYSVD